MADLKGQAIRDAYDQLLTKGSGTAIEDGDGNPFIGAIVNKLTSTATNAPLSANMGRELDEKIDDIFETGTFSPQIRVNNLTTGFTQSVEESYYSYNKVTKMVIGGFRVDITGITELPSGLVTIVGLPVVCENRNFGAVMNALCFNINVSPVLGRVNANSTIIRLFVGNTDLSHTQLTASSSFRLSFQYQGK